MRAVGDRAVFRAGAPNRPASIVALDLASGRYSVLKRATDILDRTDLHLADYLTRVESVAFPTTGGETAFGLFYPPRNPDYAPGAEERPPLAPMAAEFGLPQWLLGMSTYAFAGSERIVCTYSQNGLGCLAVLDLAKETLTGARFLAAQGRVDGKRCVISGGSAGGYTTLAALTFRDFFQGGASYYGVSDIAALARDTHKFESHYLDWLIGPYPQEQARYRERSPLYHADRLAKPVIFFQGDEDAVVPPSQAEAMVEALRRKGNPVGYFLFSGEQHGFRKAANIQRCLDAELAFYAIEVFRTGLTF
jgi:dipeptidyl aminopeptidase/acylaminoacyl peptidase